VSHRFKRPKSILPQDRRDQRQLQLMAGHVVNQHMLDLLLQGAAPGMRKVLLDRLTPYLPFAPAPLPTECPECGLAGGATQSHECGPAPLI
jgi:hypothetical protein